MTASRNKDTASGRRDTALDALRASYVPGDAKDWPGGDPGDVADALDAIRVAMRRFFQGTFIEPFDARVTSDGATVTMSIEQTGGGDLTMVFSDGHTTLEGSSTITLTPGGTDPSPQENFIYILQSTKALTKSTSDWPDAEHIRVGYFLVPTASLVNTGATGNNFLYINQNWNDECVDGVGQGHLSHIADKIRHLGATWHSGTEGVATQNGNDLWVSITSGEISQMHHHDFSALDSDTTGAGDPILVVNDPDAAFVIIHSLNEITKHSGGSNIGVAKYLKFVLWGVINKGGEVHPMMINVPDDEYSSADAAAADANRHANFGFPREFNLESSTGFLIAAFVCQHTGSGMILQSTEDLRGQTPATAGGGGGAGGGGVSSMDDLSDADTSTNPPDLNAVLKYDGTNWVPGIAGVTDEFTFSIDSFAGTETDSSQLIGSGTWVASGAMSFSATYSNDPGGMTALVTMTGTATGWSTLVMDPVTGAEPTVAATSYPGDQGDTVTFTLTQSADGSSAVDTVSFSNTMRYDTNANGIGTQTEGNVEALTEVPGPNEARNNHTISNIPTGTGGHFLTFSYASRLSSVTQVQRNSGVGFVTASFNSTATTLAPLVQTSGLTTVTNSAGFEEGFEAITARLANLTNGTNDFKLLISGTAINYLMWGEVAVAGTGDGDEVYSEANVEDNTGDGGIVASNSISNRDMQVTGGDGSKYAYIAYPSRLGLLSSIVIGGFESIGDFWIDHGSGTELDITNDAGYEEPYYVYVAKNPGFGAGTTMVVSL